MFAFDPRDFTRYSGPRASIVVGEPGPAEALLKISDVRVLRDVSHWLMLDAPAEFNAALDGILEKLG
jgi:pimeloyl-ACP methyl ester carboxylesterase